jgi:CRP-like cAMP-binding protein
VDLVGQLSRFSALRPLPRRLLELLAAGFVERQLAPGVELIRLGDRGTAAYLVLDGEISVTVETDGVVSELARLGPGNLLGHLALVDGAPASATCRAVGPVRVGELGRGAFGLLTGARAELARAFQRAIAEQVAGDYRTLLGRTCRTSGPTGVDSPQWRSATLTG